MKTKHELMIAVILTAILPVLLMPSLDSKKEIVQENVVYIDVLIDESVAQMDVEEYLVGVLLAEMPSDFEQEALKAQAVAARTFALYKSEHGGKHANATVCILASCCQAYICPEDYISIGGNVLTIGRMIDAVRATSGEVLVYEGELIEATYFSSAGGRTEDAKAVWGAEIPYLQSVESNEEIADYFFEMSKEEFCKRLGLATGNLQIGTAAYTQGGGIAEIQINNQYFTGVQLREKLGLRSTQMTISLEKDVVKITTKGHGHRVGMSQYGADAMAAVGESYKQILMHYYCGISIKSVDN